MVDYQSLPDVGWSYVIGTFQGKVVFGDVSQGDMVGETILTQDDETGSFVLMYDTAMHLQWVAFLRTMQSNSAIVATRGVLQESTGSIIITGVR